MKEVKMSYSYVPQGVCPKEINFELNEDKVENLSFVGGCNGNLKALSTMINGKTVAEVSTLFKGQTCGKKESSCMDQLVVSLENALEEAR